MSMLARLGMVLVLILALSLYQLWPRVPEGVEDPDSLKMPIFFSNLLNSIIRLQIKMGSENPFPGPRAMLLHMHAAARWATPVKQESVTVQRMAMNGVHVLVFTPVKRRNSAAVIYFHGGGFALGSVETYWKLCRDLAERTGNIVISVDYRLAPEHREPAAVDDCVAVVRHMREVGKQQFQVDPRNIALAGDSAGGYLAAAVAVKLGPNLQPPLKALGLIVPILQQLSFNTPSHVENRASPDLTRELMVIYTLAKVAIPSPLSHYDAIFVNNHSDFETRLKYARKFDLPLLSMKGPKELDAGGDPKTIHTFRHLYEDPVLSPLFADLSRFPPTVLLSSQFDVLRDDSVMMAMRLRQANRTVEEVRVQSVHIGFALYEIYKPGAKAMDTWMKKLTQLL